MPASCVDLCACGVGPSKSVAAAAARPQRHSAPICPHLCQLRLLLHLLAHEVLMRGTLHTHSTPRTTNQQSSTVRQGLLAAKGSKASSCGQASATTVPCCSWPGSEDISAPTTHPKDQTRLHPPPWVPGTCVPSCVSFQLWVCWQQRGACRERLHLSASAPALAPGLPRTLGCGR